MPRYLLDTNIIIFYLKNRASSLHTKIHQILLQDLAICSVVKAELFYGAAKSNQANKSRAIQEAFLAHFVSVPFDDSAAEQYAQIRSSLEKKGRPIGGNDLMIASIAQAHRLVLITANLREFQLIEHLSVENWIDIQ